MDGAMSSRIKCKGCGSESYNDGKTGLYCPTCFEQLQTEIEKLKEETRWISVKERLPDEFKEYEVWNKYGKLDVASWRPVLGGSWSVVEEILYWRCRLIPDGNYDSHGFWKINDTT